MGASEAVAVVSVLGGGVLAQWLAWRLKLPSIIFLLALGVLLGPVSGVFRPAAAFGVDLRPLIGLAVAVIVFEGGLGLDFRELRAAGRGVARLLLIALPVSFVLGALAAAEVGGLSWPIAFVYGAIAVVTGPAVILPLLRVAKLDRKTASHLKWEGIICDPVGAILTGFILQLLVAGADAHVNGLVFRVTLGAFGGAAASVAAAYGAAWAFRRDQLPEVLKTPLLVAADLCLYVIANAIFDQAGLIAATVFGVALANLNIPGLNEVRRFKEALAVLLVSALFIILAADLDRSVLGAVTWRLALLTVMMMAVVRPLAIALATIFSDTTWPERALMGWIAPRGIVAAATAGVVGLQLSQSGYKDAALIQPAIFVLIAATVVVHGFSVKPLARALGLGSESGPNLAILGASPWTTDLAAVLTKGGESVLLIDSFPGALRIARRLGVATLQVEILSRQAEEDLADNPIEFFWAATPDPIYNALVCARLGPEIGRERVYQIAPPHEHMVDPEEGMSRDWRGKIVLGPEFDFKEFASRYEDGWRFGLFEALSEEAKTSVVLFFIRAGGSIEFRSKDQAEDPKPAEGDRVVAMVRQERRLP